MLARRFAFAPAALFLSACIDTSIVDSPTPITFLPALETITYDSLGGAKIAFQRFGTGAASFSGVYVVDASIPIPRAQSLLANQALDRAQLSPDGFKLVFGGATGESSSIFDIFVVKLSDSTRTRLTSVVANEEGSSWSMDGTQIFYYIRGNSITTLFRQSPVTNAADVVSTVLADSGGFQWNIDGPLSPDAASRVLFSTYTQGFRLWATNIDGSSRVILKTDLSLVGPVFQAPTWSPDGTKIAFLQLNYDANNRMTSTQLKTMNPDATGETIIATVATPGTVFQSNSLTDFSVCYSGPTGTRIFFTAIGADGSSHVYVVRPTGGPVFQVTTNSGTWDRGVSCKRGGVVLALTERGVDR